MSDQSGGGKKVRRRIKVAGESEDAPQRAKVRSIEEVLGLDRDPKDAPEAEGVMYPPELMQKFLAGQITLGDLEGISKQEQYQIAQLGHGYLASAKLDKAKIVFEALLALDPFDAYFHTALGSIAQQAEDLEEAEARYTRALEINPFSPTAYANRGEIRVLGGRLDDGVADLIRAVEEDKEGREPGTMRARATLQVLKEQLGALGADELKKRASEATESKVQAAKEAVKKPGGPARKQGVGPRARPRPRPRPRARPSRSGPRRPGPKKK